jgi:hypothetical protein
MEARRKKDRTMTGRERYHECGWFRDGAGDSIGLALLMNRAKRSAPRAFPGPFGGARRSFYAACRPRPGYTLETVQKGELCKTLFVN